MSATIAARDEPTRLIVISAGTTAPSSTRLLADRLAQRVHERLLEEGVETDVQVIELSRIAVEIAQSLVSGLIRPQVKEALTATGAADGLIVTTPVYKAGMSGLFKSFVDLMENDLLIAKPVILAATGGTPRHSMVVDDQMRSLFAFFRTLTMPTSIYAAPEDWSSADLGTRIDRAAVELALVLRRGLPKEMADQNWSRHQHPFNGDTKRVLQPSALDFDTELMRLATGGSSVATGPTQHERHDRHDPERGSGRET